MQISNTTKTFVEEINKYKLVKQTVDIDELIKCLYNEILLGFNYYNDIKSTIQSETKKINNVNKIPFPSSISDKFFPKDIENNIKSKSNFYATYNIEILGYKFKIVLVYALNTFNIEYYVSVIITWLHIVLNYATSKCSKNITIFIYLTDKSKKLPSNELDILDVINVNSAYTYCCRNPKTKNEIVIFRKEEWFKTLIHETMHAFGLDFCKLDNDFVSNKIKTTFPINSDINLNESYCEFWAETLNILIISFFSLKSSDTIDTYLQSVKNWITYEKTFSIIQLIKILKYMNLEYTDLYKNNKMCVFKRNFFYHENTNVFSYYIIKCILMYNLEDFILWCVDNNINALDFFKTTTNIENFIQFIVSKYNNKQFIKIIKANEKIFNKFSNTSKFYTSTKMSLLEIK